MSNSILVDGKKIAARLQNDLKNNLLELNFSEPIKLAVILVGDDPASQIYANKKKIIAKDLGIICDVYELSKNSTAKEVIEKINFLQQDKNLYGLIIQLPLPDNLWSQTRLITDHIRPELDVDCLSHFSLGKILMNELYFVPPIIGAVREILNEYKIELEGKHVCLVGRGELIGRPLAAYFLNLPVTLSVCGKSTKKLSDITKQADILISGVGKPNLINAAMVKSGAVVIDLATTYNQGKVQGDIDFNSVKTKASLLTPVPGGIGPITVIKLMENIVFAVRNKKST